MEAPGYRLNLPPTALKARFIMIEEGSKTMFDVDLVTDRLRNPPSWIIDGITPANTGHKLAIVVPNPLDEDQRKWLVSEGGKTDFETGMLVSITAEEDKVFYANIIGRVNLCPFPETVMNWDKVKEYKGDVMHDELKNGLLARVFGGRDLGIDFVHPSKLAVMPRPWHKDAAVLNTELDRMFASGHAIRSSEARWMLSENDD